MNQRTASPKECSNYQLFLTANITALQYSIYSRKVENLAELFVYKEGIIYSYQYTDKRTDKRKVNMETDDLLGKMRRLLTTEGSPVPKGTTVAAVAAIIAIIGARP